MTGVDKKHFTFLAISSLLLLIGWYCGYAVAPMDGNQGQVYRIIFIHVPVAAAAMALCSGGLFVYSILGLIKLDSKFLIAGKAWAEVGLIFTILTLFTGSIWGRPTWGTWWTWDARLTTTFLLALLFIAYLILHSSLSAGRERIRVCSVLGILIFVDVPIIYKSVSWWRTLHQPTSIIESRGDTMDPEMLRILLLNIFLTALFCISLWLVRRLNLSIRAEIENLSLSQLR